MCKRILTEKLVKRFFHFVILLFVLHSVSLKSQDRFILTESEMPGYELERQENDYRWIINENYDVRIGIEQKWKMINGNCSIYISYCKFSSFVEAYQAISFCATTRTAVPYLWGSLNGTIVGDGSWVPINNSNAIYFLRGNVGIQVFTSNFEQGKKEELLAIIDNLLNKIEINLSEYIVAFERNAKLKQIPLNSYSLIVDPVLHSQDISEFKFFNSWDSKWPIDTEDEDFTFGIRREWRNNSGSILGIDIAQFNTEFQATRSSDLISHNSKLFYNKFDLNNPESIKEVIASYERSGISTYSFVGSKGNVAIRFYIYNPAGINKDLVTLIAGELSEHIGNF